MPLTFLIAAAALGTTPPRNFEALAQPSEDAPFCTADGEICVTGTRDGIFGIVRKGQRVAQWTAASEDNDARFEPLPTLLRLKDGGLLVGVGVVRNQMYSGGNASVTFQRIMLVRPGKAPATVLEVPYASEISIRACFDEKDTRRRLDACHDEYTLESHLKAEATQTSGLPDLSLSVMSESFPRGVSRNEDSLAKAPLKKEDLVEVTDEACSYTRTFRFDAASGTYRTDTPLPDCEQYTVP